MKRFITLLLAFALMLSVASFSSAEEEPMVITVFGPDISTGEYTLTDENTYFGCYAALEKKFNVDLQFNTTNSYGSIVETRLAAGEQLEDLFCIGYADVKKYADAGLFKDLTDLIPEYAPNLAAFYEINPDGRSYNTVNGRQYAVSESEYYFKDLCDCYGWFIRQDWLDQLGLEVPTTLDGLYDTLIAFQEAKLGGGSPVIAAEAGVLLPMLLGNPFGLRTMYEDAVDVDENGKIVYGFASDEYKEMLKFINKLYNANLLDPMFPNMSGDSMRELMATDNCALFCNQTNNLGPYFLQYFLAGNPDAKLTVLNVLEGPNGAKTQFACANEWKRYVIPATVSDEKAIRILQILDYTMGTEEGRNLLWYGVEGETMAYDENGTPYYLTDAIKGGDDWRNNGLRTYTFPLVYCPATQYDDWPFDTYNQTVELAANMTPGIHFMKMPAPDAASELINKPDLNTYFDETRTAFMTGKLDIDENWDAFVARMYELGLDEKIEGLQIWYDSVK